MSTTPSEEEFPLIISVDDHILEPRDLWERELPAAWRERGPRCVREKTKSTFKGGVLTMERDVDDGQWTDVWLFDDLVLGTNRLHAAGGLPVEEHKNVPAIYEDFRPGAYDQAARLADMDTNHQEVGINYPNTFPRFAGQGFAERGDKDARPRQPPDLQRLDDRRVVRRRRPWPPRAADPHPAVGPRGRGRRGAPVRGQGQLRHRLQREPGQARLLVALHR